MTPTTNKLEEVHADMWGPYYSLVLSEKIYSTIFYCEFIRKI